MNEYVFEIRYDGEWLEDRSVFASSYEKALEIMVDEVLNDRISIELIKEEAPLVSPDGSV